MSYRTNGIRKISIFEAIASIFLSVKSIFLAHELKNHEKSANTENIFYMLYGFVHSVVLPEEILY